MKTTLVALALGLAATGAFAADDDDGSIRHVLIVSIDGVHQQDLARCLDRQVPAPTSRHSPSTGVNYTQAFTPGLSGTFSSRDSGALVTGGSPRSTGPVLRRHLRPHALCGEPTRIAPAAQGVEVFLQELVGIDGLNGGALIHLDGGGAFNPQQIPRREVGTDCVPVYPHDFILTNTIFEVVKQNLRGSHTALVRQACLGTDWVNGPSGKGVDDMARTEINSLDGPAGNDYTGSFDWCRLPPIRTPRSSTTSTSRTSSTRSTARTRTGTKSAPVPTAFGTNFQTLSVAQKAPNATGGGYADAAFTPNPFVKDAITYVDGAIGELHRGAGRQGPHSVDPGGPQCQTRSVTGGLRAPDEDRPCRHPCPERIRGKRLGSSHG